MAALDDHHARGTKRKRDRHAHDENADLGEKVDRKAFKESRARDVERATGNDKVVKPQRRGAEGTDTSNITEKSGRKKVGPLESTANAGRQRHHAQNQNGTLSAPSPRSTPGKSTTLPIVAHKQEIITALETHPVLILTGETGSGKSTQVPQYLLSPKFLSASKAGSNAPKLKIAVTQPRRVAATSLAKRVATEMRCPLGKAAGARVGYSVRFDANVGRDNEVVYLTEGMLLMEMLRDPGLTGYGVVVVDEVHERGVDVDLLMGFLRGLVRGEGEGARKRREKGRKDLRVVVMSATADVEGLRRYFGEVLEDANDEGKEAGEEEEPGEDGDNSVVTVKVEGRQYPVQITYLSEPAQDFVEAALKAVFQVHCKEPMPGDVLVFMTGQETIQGLQRNIEEYAQSLGPEFPKVSPEFFEGIRRRLLT